MLSLETAIVNFWCSLQCNEMRWCVIVPNAEAEAEVAEGMAYGAANRTVPLLEEDQGRGDREEAMWETLQSDASPETVDEPDITLKIPHAGIQETE